MPALDDLLAHYRKFRAQILDDIRVWRTAKMRMTKNGADVTEEWLAEMQRRADDLAKVIAAYEKHAA
jgi:hypothetical protein